MGREGRPRKNSEERWSRQSRAVRVRLWRSPSAASSLQGRVHRARASKPPPKQKHWDLPSKTCHYFICSLCQEDRREHLNLFAESIFSFLLTNCISRQWRWCLHKTSFVFPGSSQLICFYCPFRSSYFFFFSFFNSWKKCTELYNTAQMVKHLPAMRETQVRSLGWEDSL